MVRHQSRVIATFAAMLLCGFSAPVRAQLTRPPNPDAPILVVVTFKSTDKKLGVDFAEQVRDKITGDVSYRDLQMMTKATIDGTLQASGYDLTSALTEGDANLLAKQLRADEYIEGEINKDASGKFVVTSWMVLTRDPTLLQPLGNFEGPSQGNVSSQISKAYQSAHKAYDDIKKCLGSRRESKYPDALSSAQSAISKYPRSTIARICEMGVMNDQKKPAADVLKVAQEILAIDPKSKPAMETEVDAYEKLGDKPAKAKLLVQLLAANPTDSKLQQAVIYEYAQSGNFAEALKIISKAVDDNPGDIAFVKLDWQILYAMKDYKTMWKMGEQMIQLDTSTADTTFFDRTIDAQRLDSNFANAATVAARATKKYPNRADYWAQRGSMELKTGQVKQAITSLRRALEIDPKLAGARMLIISSLVDAGELDSASVAMREAIKSGEDQERVASFALAIASKIFKIANDTKPPVLALWQRVLPSAMYADSISKDRGTKNTAAFEMGVSHYYVASIMYPDVVAQKDCNGAKIVQDAVLAAGSELPRGGATNPAAVGQLMPNIQQMATAVDQAVKVFCAPPKKP